MLIVALGWIYVVLMAAVAEALSPQGTLLGAFFTFVLYGVLPLTVVMYLLGTPARKRALRNAAGAERARASEAAEAAEAAKTADGSTQAARVSGEPASAARADPDGGGHAPGRPVAPKREEP